MGTPHAGPRTVDDARETVDWYFGELLTTVARESPVSASRLGHALARIQLAADRRRALLDERGETVPAVAGDGEAVFALPEEVWSVLAGAQDVSSLEALAARETHRRMAVSLGATVEEDAVPLVLVTC